MLVFYCKRSVSYLKVFIIKCYCYEEIYRFLSQISLHKIIMHIIVIYFVKMNLRISEMILNKCEKCKEMILCRKLRRVFHINMYSYIIP